MHLLEYCLLASVPHGVYNPHSRTKHLRFFHVQYLWTPMLLFTWIQSISQSVACEEKQGYLAFWSRWEHLQLAMCRRILVGMLSDAPSLKCSGTTKAERAADSGVPAGWRRSSSHCSRHCNSSGLWPLVLCSLGCWPDCRTTCRSMTSSRHLAKKMDIVVLYSPTNIDLIIFFWKWFFFLEVWISNMGWITRNYLSAASTRPPN